MYVRVITETIAEKKSLVKFSPKLYLNYFIVANYFAQQAEKRKFQCQSALRIIGRVARKKKLPMKPMKRLKSRERRASRQSALTRLDDTRAKVVR